MGYLVRMPQMGMEMDQGEVVGWECDEGDSVDDGEVIAVVESEKAINEIEAREAGALRRILVPEGGTVEPGTPIGIIADPDEDLSQYESQLDESDPDADAGTDGQTRDAVSGDSTVEATAESGGDGPAGAVATDPADTDDSQRADTAGTDGDQSSVRATPGAKQLAETEDVDLRAVEGTGPQGVVTEDDVETHLAEAQADAGSPTGPAEDGLSAEAVRATPGAKQLAETEDVDLRAVEGTGPQGVVTEDDVETHLEADSAVASATRTVQETQDLSGMQATISDRLGESYRNAVHVTVKRQLDATVLEEVVTAANAADLDVSLSDLLLRAVGAELEARPAFNAVFEDGQHKRIAEVNVGVAVDVEDGLLTPVVPTVTEKSVEEVATVRTELIERVRSGEFTSDDLAGGTFTVTNLGPFGVDSFDPVINPPEVAILGVGRVREDDRLTLSLSFDHRVVNGADAARFLGGLVETVTDPLALAAYFEADVLDAPGVEVSVETDSDA